MMENQRGGHAKLRRGRVSLADQIYIATTTTDRRVPYFGDFAVAQAAARCFEDALILDGAVMLAWVLMPDHVHWLLQLGETQSLSHVVNRLKSASARKANLALRRSGALWAPAFHDHGLRREEDVASVARYIVSNPVRAGLVARIGDYPFWNAVWL